MSLQSGFTLVEVLIALAVFAVLAVTLHAKIGQVDIDGRRLEERVFASWLAANKLADMRIAMVANNADVPAPVPGAGGTEMVSFAGRQWRLESQIIQTSDRDLYRVEVEVYRDGSAARSWRLIGFLPTRAKPRP